MEENKKAEKPKRKKPVKVFKGIVIEKFNFKGESYSIGNEFSTKFKDTYDLFINTKKIKQL